MPKGQAIIRWDAANDAKLLKLICKLQGNDLKKDEIAKAWGPDVPTFCISKRINKLKKEDANGTAGTPVKSTTTTNSNGKRAAKPAKGAATSRTKKAKKEVTDEAESSDGEDDVAMAYKQEVKDEDGSGDDPEANPLNELIAAVGAAKATNLGIDDDEDDYDEDFAPRTPTTKKSTPSNTTPSGLITPPTLTRKAKASATSGRQFTPSHAKAKAQPKAQQPKPVALTKRSSPRSVKKIDYKQAYVDLDASDDYDDCDDFDDEVPENKLAGSGSGSGLCLGEEMVSETSDGADDDSDAYVEADDDVDVEDDMMMRV
ncbi:MAG: hypothetical protein M1819_006500 [Sarea resinae]|nr:MAG: hypothetical protein M1819_006500 [Sarea resinae]